MIPLPTSALDVVFATRYGWTIIPIFFAACAALIIFAQSDINSARDRNTAALDLWLEECAKSIEVCAKDWDDSHTLRDIYRARIQ